MQRQNPISPFAPQRFPDLPQIGGLRITGLTVGLKRSGKPDVMIAECPGGAATALVTTKSQTRSAAVDWCRTAITASQGRTVGIIANSGNSNAFTGARGLASVRDTVHAGAKILDCRPEEVLIASTGVIGEPLDSVRILDNLHDGVSQMRGSQQSCHWQAAARSIETTDTYSKGASRSIEIEGVPVNIVGIAKGSGMIAPDMATMLAFLFSDVPIDAGVLAKLFRSGVERSFNAITVDSDTSTSDTAMILATGVAELPSGPIIRPNDARLRPLRQAIWAVMTDLARQIVMDGEGASRLIEIRVRGAVSGRAARRIGLAVGNSPLVKTAVAGGDANWGRIVMAVGKSGERADRDRLSIAMGGVVVAEGGAPRADYDEAKIDEHLQGREILIEIDIGIGRGSAVVWTCDFTYGYISINGSYRS